MLKSVSSRGTAQRTTRFPVRLNYFVAAIFSFCLLFLLSCGGGRSGNARVLVFSKTAGFHHTSIPAGQAAIIKLGQENKFRCRHYHRCPVFCGRQPEELCGRYFLNTTEDVLNSYQEAEFERYIQSGGGFVGVHSATDTEYDWGWYGRLVGAYFSGHPEQQEAVINVVDANNPATKHLPKQWRRKDEWYNFKKLNPDVHVLLSIDESTYKGGTNGTNHPMAWYHEYDGGRAFYTELGHTEESYAEPLI
jgi:cytochrome c